MGSHRSDPPVPTRSTRMRPAPPSQAPELTTEDAVLYLRAVKRCFQDQRDKYDEFLVIMREFKHRRIDTGAVVRAAKILFDGHPELIFGLNKFLPREYQIKLEENKPV